MRSNIKNLAPDKKSRYFQGYFKNAKKYFGKEPIIYRSSLEFIFMQKLEMNPNVDKWSSENISIPYIMRERVNNKFVDKTHTYWIDFMVIMKNGKRFIVEIKPEALTPLNESQIHRNPVMYKNACKWRSAIAWCNNNGYKFLVLNEKHLKGQIF